MGAGWAVTRKQGWGLVLQEGGLPAVVSARLSNLYFLISSSHYSRDSEIQSSGSVSKYSRKEGITPAKDSLI